MANNFISHRLSKYFSSYQMKIDMGEQINKFHQSSLHSANQMLNKKIINNLFEYFYSIKWNILLIFNIYLKFDYLVMMLQVFSMQFTRFCWNKLYNLEFNSMMTLKIFLHSYSINFSYWWKHELSKLISVCVKRQ